ncbi:MAG: hypothetical protein FJY67_12130, partial [Calditrichaeota bacterium]|nr:hypothetical protein [Calditrichota bacterium]
MILPLIHLKNPAVVSAQPRNEWIRYYRVTNQSNAFTDVFQQRDGNLALCGYATWVDSLRSQMIWLMVADPDGQRLFESTYRPEEGERQYWPWSLIQCDDGGWAIAGQGGLLGDIGRFHVIKVDSDRNLSWSQYYSEQSGRCYAIIETKSGNLLVCGDNSDRDGGVGYYAMLRQDDGEVIWDQTYRTRVTSIREEEGGYLMCGGPWLFKVDEEGDQVWEREYQGSFWAIVRYPEGGYVLSGGMSMDGGRYITPMLVRINADLNLEWQHTYEQLFPQNGITIAHALTLAEDGGIFTVRYWSPWILRTNPAGETSWLRWDRHGTPPRAQGTYSSVILSDDGAALVSGGAVDDSNRVSGVIIKITPDHSPPRIIDWQPRRNPLTVLSGSELAFMVRAIDAQGDSIRYSWLRNGDFIRADSSVTIDFPNRGQDTIICIVSDGELRTSRAWLVHVRDLLIASHTPDTLSLSVQRNSEIDFSLDSVAYIGDLENLRYEWMIYDSAAVRWEEVAGDDRIGIRSYVFDRAGGY